MILPAFRYHPEPRATGVVSTSSATCRSCNQARGAIYSGPVYCIASVQGSICPWCIADGSAASAFDATFNDYVSLQSAGVRAEIIHEVTRRTPGYHSWQQDVWLSHCNDACAFWGDLPAERLEAMDPEGRHEFMREHGVSEANWRTLLGAYVPGGQPAIYVFRCLHCPRELYHMDYT